MFTSSVDSVDTFDPRRYRRVVFFFARAFAALIWWDIILRALLGRRFVARSAMQRWRGLARRFRVLAVEKGGLLIKLGQFLSTRVDILPPPVTDELAGLQDEVPPETLADIQGVIAAEFARPVDQVFDWLAPEPEAAASLAQVHRARLRSGEEVAVKVQRPRIETLVETDLRAIRTAVQWLRRYRPIQRRVDLAAILDEFSRTTRAELDFVAEGHNAEHFAHDFADDPGIQVPTIYWDYTTRRVLTMENVAAIKITDFAAIENAGVRRSDVAARLFNTYLRQIFVHNFVHADPHPGNLFVRPLDPPSPDAPRPFVLVFVDFGMVATVPQQLRAALREYLIGLGTRDAGRIVRAYRDAGVLLPGADLALIEKVQAEMMERFWGLTMSEVSRLAFTEGHRLVHQYRQLIYEMPFQFPAEVLFVGRAIGVLAGMATRLDPDFNAWAAMVPFAEQLAAEETARTWRDWLPALADFLRVAIALPGQADRFFAQAARGELTVKAALDPGAATAIHRLERAVNRLAWAVIFAALLIAGILLYISGGPPLLVYSLILLSALMLVVGLLRR